MNKQQRTKVFRLNQQGILRLAICSALAQAFMVPAPVFALPSGADVQFGQSTIQTNGGQMQINQTSQNAIVNWQSFRIGAGESVRLLQPSQGSALYRVVGSESSHIFGNLSATGNLFLVNPNGVLFGQGAQVDVGGLMASTLNISNSDFLGGKYQFATHGGTGSVVNQGVIRAADGGYVVLLGNEVSNSGTVIANKGSVVMGAAESAVLDFYGNGLVRATLSGDALKAVVDQAGSIQADGGAVQLATSSRSSAINVSGIVQANSLVNRNGVIRLEGGANARVSVRGTLSATGGATGATGGRIEVTGEQVALFKGATVDASGDAGGGTVLVGGDFQGKNADVYNARTTYVDKDASMNVDATNAGDGGKAVVWSNEVTRYYGSISAKGGAQGGNGGFAEVSGERVLNFAGKADLSASNGLAGNLLLDPLNITLTTVDANTAGFTPPGDITEAFADDAGLTSTFNVNAAGSFAGIAAGSTITLQATNDITVSSAFNVATATGSANNSLVLQANNNINVNAAVTTSGTGAITMSADADASGVGGVSVGAAITAATGAINLSGATVSGAGNIASGSLKTITATTGTSTLSGVISGTGALTKTGAGTLTLSGANTYTGVTNINAGTLLATSSGALGAAPGGTTVASGATLAVQGGITLADALTITGTGVGAGGAVRNISGNNTLSGAITLGAGGARINSDAGTLAISGGNITGAQPLTVGGAGNTTISKVIATGTGTLTKDGVGTLTLSGANTYTGATNINAGTLQLGSANRINDVSAVTVASGATFNLNNFSETVGSISGAGNINLGTATLTTGNATNTTFSGVISGGGGVTKVGTGMLTLSGANAYTGATNINAGTLLATNSSSLGAASGGTTIRANSTLALQGGITIADALNITGTGASVGGAVRNISGDNNLTGALVLGGAARINSDAGTLTISGASNITGTQALTVGGAGNTTISKVIATGTGTLTKDGAGTLTLSGANTYTGATNINAGTLLATSSGALGAAPGGTTVVSGATLAVQGGITLADALTITGTGVGAGGAVRNISGNNTLSGAITLGAGGARINSDAGTLTISGGNITGAQPLTVGGAGNTTISKVIATGAGTLTKDGAGTLTLSGANTYTGATNINAGTLTATNATALGTAAGGTTVASGATLNIDNVGINTGEAVTLNGTLQGMRNAALSGPVTLNSVGTAINTPAAGDSLSLPGVVGGLSANALTKTGRGTLTLNGVNTYLGATNINAGTLNLGVNGTIANSSGVANNANFTLLNSKTIDSLTGAGTTVLGNVTTVLTIGDNSNTSSTYNGAINGTGGIVKAGTGTLTLGGTSGYTGATTVNAGTLSATSANALGAAGGGTTVANGAALNVNGTTINESAIVISGTGVAGTGALAGTGVAGVTGTVTTAGAAASAIGTTSPASTLTLNGAVVATANNLNIVGAGSVTATSATNDFGTVNINGAQNVNLRDANAMTIGGGASNLTGNLTVQAGGNLTVANAVTATGGDITLASTNFINNAGAAALSTSGRWLVYSAAPATNTFGGLVSGNQAIWNTAYPTAILQTGNRYIFTSSPIVTVTSTNQSKTYGQNGAPIVANAFTATGFVNAATFGNVFVQDTAANSLSGSATSTGASTTTGVGSYAVDVTPITATTGYALSRNSTGLLTVNPAALTITANDQTKTYGNTLTFLGTEFITGVGQLQNGETVTNVNLVSAGSVNTANVAIYVIASNAATGGGGFNASNYLINYVDGTMTVNPAVINLNGARNYDGTTAFNAASFGTVSGVLGQTLGLTGAGSVASANAGVAQALSIGTLAVANGTGQASNYTLVGGTHTGIVNKANLTISTSDVIKTYDGTLAAAGTATVTSGTLFNNASNGGAQDNLSGGTFAFTNANAGAGNKTVTVGSVTVNDGNSGGNYNVTYADNTSSTINKANITAVTGISANNKTYDGTTNATLNTGAAGFTGIVGAETLTVGSASGTFNSKDVVTANTVNISGITLADGATGLASNYNLTTNTASAAANITPRALIVTANPGQGKMAGSTDPVFSYTLGGLGLVAGDALTGKLARVSGESVGAYAFHLGSLDAGTNYLVTFNIDNFTISAPPVVPRNAAGLGSLPVQSDSRTQSVAILGKSQASGVEGQEGDLLNTACLDVERRRLNTPNVSVVLNSGIRLPKGVKLLCI